MDEEAGEADVFATSTVTGIDEPGGSIAKESINRFNFKRKVDDWLFIGYDTIRGPGAFMFFT